MMLLLENYCRNFTPKPCEVETRYLIVNNNEIVMKHFQHLVSLPEIMTHKPVHRSCEQFYVRTIFSLLKSTISLGRRRLALTRGSCSLMASRLRNIHVVHDGHRVRLSNQSDINSCCVLVRMLAIANYDPDRSWVIQGDRK